MRLKNCSPALSAAIGLLLCVCCTKEIGEPGNTPVQKGEYIVASLSEVSKTTLASDGKTPLWAAGDKIALYSYASASDKDPVRADITLVSSGTPSETQGVISDGGGSFTFCRPAALKGDIYAIYPASVAGGLTKRSTPEGEDVLVFTIPQTQTGSFGAANICSGKVAQKKIAFSNQTAILAFTLSSDVTKVVITPEGSTASYTLVPDKTKADSESGPFYVAVPASKIKSGFAKYFNGDLVIGGKELAAEKTLVINKIYKIGQISSLKFSGLFSISENTKVRFTLGNLYHNGSAFELESHQYDFRTWAAKNCCIGGVVSADGTPSGHCGLLYWSQREGVSYKLGYNDEDEDFECLFTNQETSTPKAGFVVCGVKGTLRTLSNLEWAYLLSDRTGADLKCATGKVAGVPGLILIPDSFTDPKPGGKSFNAGFEAGWSRNDYSAQAWDGSMEPAGAVFLPAASTRQNANITDPGMSGLYWSSESMPFSAADSTNLAASAFGIHIGSLSVSSGSFARSRDYGSSVRLVQDSN